MSIRGRSGWSAVGCAALGAAALVVMPRSAAAGGASVRGAVISSVDGSPVRDAAAYAVLRHSSGGIDVRSAVSGRGGAFAFSGLAPGRYAIAADKRGWQGTLGAPAYVAVRGVDKTALAHPLTLTPVGYAQVSYRSRAGHPIAARYLSLSVDGCAPAPALGPGRLCGVRGINDKLAERGHAWREYVLAPGTHVLHALVRAPLDGSVRRVTRTITVRGGDAYTTSAPVLQFRADPVTRARIVSISSGRTVTVRLPSYTDGTSPRLPAVLEMDGSRVLGTSISYSRSASGVARAHVTVPSARVPAGRLRAVIPGTPAYRGAVTSAITVTR